MHELSEALHVIWSTGGLTAQMGELRLREVQRHAGGHRAEAQPTPLLGPALESTP
jgi:hypothetical protein